MKHTNTIVILGVTGDLSKRRILPALIDLHASGELGGQVIGIGLENISTHEVLSAAHILPASESSLKNFASNFSYLSGDLTNEAVYKELYAVLHDREVYQKVLFYLVLPPAIFGVVTQNLGKTDLIGPGSKSEWCKVLYEKPFGLDEASAHKINTIARTYLSEDQIIRADHYLAKESVATLSFLRFANQIFEPLWNHTYIDWVKIDLGEVVTVGNSALYDKVGVLGDVVQNHMLQIVALMGMEAPTSLQSKALSDVKAAVLSEVVPIDGLYGNYRGYESKTMHTPTFAALALHIQNKRWQGVKWFLRAGKGLQKKETTITIMFKKVTCLFAQGCPTQGNRLVIRIFPAAGFSLYVNARKAGPRDELIEIPMDFFYQDEPNPFPINTYKDVLIEVLENQQALSVRLDEIISSWRVIAEIKKLSLPIFSYEVGSAGPKEAVEWFKKMGVEL